ncbi:MAG: tetratricopeptide repeat protein [Chloroflexi bacterium]|nr:tetratricopeptide repeat protein [Chloroflexota bacterium]
MAFPILATKLYIPSPRSKVVLRPRLIARLNEGLRHKVILVSAPAGFGKTTLVSEWVNQKMKDESGKMKEEENLHPSSFILHPSKVAWLSLDKGDGDPASLLTYLIAALQTLAPNLGQGVLSALQAAPPPPTESLLTTLLNEIAALAFDFILVLDDYQCVDAKAVDDALAFLIEHLPPQMHLVIATREDPHLPLAQLRARDQLTELRAFDLRFTPSEAAEFLNQVMGLNLSAEDIAALETRTEGWIAGLQLAAISMQGHKDAAGFIQSFTGSHRFVMDYLVEQVLQQQPETIQTFLLHTSILNRMCGPLCDAVLGKDESGTLRVKDEKNSSSFTRSVHPSSFILESLERANLFIVPLDNERRWYRYHHLFAELLRQRLSQSACDVAELHTRASEWYEDNDLESEAFHHATAANDVARAERLIEGKGMPLHFRGVVAPVLTWLNAQPKHVLDAYPSLWTSYASVLLVSGQGATVEQKLQAAEAVLQNAEPNDKTRDLLGRVAAIRATIAINHYQVETVIAQSRRALEYLHPNNLAFRTFTIWKLGYAYHLQGDRAAARQAYTEAIAISQTTKNTITTIAATIGLALIQETENQLDVAAETYRRALQLLDDQPLPIAFGAHLGLARIAYEWNDLPTAEHHYQQGVQFARLAEDTDRSIIGEIFLARLKLAQGDVNGAATILAQTEQKARQNNFSPRLPEIAAVQLQVRLKQANLPAAAELTRQFDLPLSRARVLIAQNDPSAALAVLESYRKQVEAKKWQDEQLKAMVLQAVAHYANGEKAKSAQVLGDALTLGEPGGLIRLFVDEGEPMRLLISDFRFSILKTAPHLSTYLDRLLAAFGTPNDLHPSSFILHPLVEPLSQRELEVLRLIAQGLSNREIGERLFLALSTVKGHSRIIFDKLQVHNRTEAAARARELGLLQ